MLNKNINIVNKVATLLVILPLLIGFYLFNYKNFISMNSELHFYYVLISSFIAFLVSIVSYLEYKEKNETRLFFISIGFLGTSIIYNYHGLVTPNLNLLNIFTFPSLENNINAFVLMGDLSRLWFASMLIFSEKIFTNNKRYLNIKSYIILGSLLTISLFIILLNPEILPIVKSNDGVDNYLAMIIKNITLIFLGINSLKYYYSYKAKPSLSILSILLGIIFIMLTVLIFMFSHPWGSLWWLAHHLFLSSYLIIGAGILYSYYNKKDFVYFDVLGEVNNYMSNLKKKNEELNFLANFDQLTELPNRHHFFSKLNEKINNNLNFALLFIDIDDFKKINDTYGHDLGDKALKFVAKRIEHNVKKDDLVARIGGDEFIILIKNTEVEELEKIAERLIHKLNKKIEVSNYQLNLSISIGISIFPRDGKDADELISKSDKAMYLVKSNAKNNYAFFNSTL